ncbi:MAG: hypothetical protein DWQ34_13370 [Planctomycetota bacterium]|nr:MAG: hypothetical protein DWQ34_13370 [Planctomycetota bacterium]REJ96254.1 MAG: hypothetical protein DWQ29_00970 [Planctomycetota bacterium]
MIPEFDSDGLLPVGIHTATLEEFFERFARFQRSDRRLRVCEGLQRLVRETQGTSIVRKIIVGGSLVTNKAEPNDFDCILVLDPSIVGRELRPFEYNLVSRKHARRIYGGDVLAALDGSQAMEEFLEFFQSTREGKSLGVVEIAI